MESFRNPHNHEILDVYFGCLSSSSHRATLEETPRVAKKSAGDARACTSTWSKRRICDYLWNAHAPLLCVERKARGEEEGAPEGRVDGRDDFLAAREQDEVHQRLPSRASQLRAHPFQMKFHHHHHVQPLGPAFQQLSSHRGHDFLAAREEYQVNQRLPRPKPLSAPLTLLSSQL